MLSMHRIFQFVFLICFGFAFWVSGMAYGQTLRFVEGSAVKVEQLIGDIDFETGEPSSNQTFTKVQLAGSDLGCSFEDPTRNRLIIAFGDSMHSTDIDKKSSYAEDPIAWSRTRDPEGERGFELNFWTEPKRPKRFLRIHPPDTYMAAFEVPTGGIAIDGEMYLFCWVGNTRDEIDEANWLLQFDETTREFPRVREISRLDQNGKFLQVSPAWSNNSLEPKLPTQERHLMLLGAGEYRKSLPYLASVTPSDLLGGKPLKYFAGTDDKSNPIWSLDESRATPLFETRDSDGEPCLGEVSLSYCKGIDRWLVVYSRPEPNFGVALRHAKTPWGPWSDEEIIFNPHRDQAYDRFIHRADREDHLSKAELVIGTDDPTEAVTRWGACYGAYQIPRFTKFDDGRLTIYYTLSTWNPYTVVLMKSSVIVLAE